MRKQIWKLHSWIGLACALALVVIGFTGSVLVFHEDITDQLYPELKFNASHDAEVARMAPSTLATIVEERFPDFWIRGWLLKYESKHRDRAYLNKRGEDEWYILHIDPYTGESGEAPIPIGKTLYGWFVDLHYTFFADHWGMALTGIFALGFLFLGISGIYLHRPFFKALFRLRWGKSARIFYSDLHKAIGIATIPMNLILGFTGAYWNFSHIIHEWIEHQHEEEGAVPQEFADYRLHLDQLDARANEVIPGYTLNYIYFPTDEDPNFYLYGAHPGAHRLNNPYGSTVFIDAKTCEISAYSDLREAGLWSRIVNSFEPLHFGDFGGITTKILWCMAGLSPAVLSISGVLMYFKRGRRRK